MYVVFLRGAFYSDDFLLLVRFSLVTFSLLFRFFFVAFSWLFLYVWRGSLAVFMSGKMLGVLALENLLMNVPPKSCSLSSS